LPHKLARSFSIALLTTKREKFMPNITPVTPVTAAPADRLDLTETGARSSGASISVLGQYCCGCFADDE
jgi:hypothetical protein